MCFILPFSNCYIVIFIDDFLREAFYLNYIFYHCCLSCVPLFAIMLINVATFAAGYTVFEFFPLWSSAEAISLACDSNVLMSLSLQ